jgi:tRNA (cytidine32/uridine32-2'-O)-methyltransferase
VQIIADELRMKLFSPTGNAKPSRDNLATVDEVEQFYEHLRDMLVNIDFLKPSNPKKLLQRLRRMFNRTKLESVEVNILRGILTNIEKALPKKKE